MKNQNWRAVLLAAMFSLIVGVLCSCVATAPQTGWMDLPHARSLDKKKGKQLKKLQKDVALNRHH